MLDVSPCILQHTKKGHAWALSFSLRAPVLLLVVALFSPTTGSSPLEYLSRILKFPGPVTLRKVFSCWHLLTRVYLSPSSFPDKKACVLQQSHPDPLLLYSMVAHPPQVL